MASTGIVFDIKKYALHDGPGIRTTVFLKGCPLTCDWCHNPEGIHPHPEIVYTSDRCLGCQSCVSSCPQTALRLTDAGVVRDSARCGRCGTCTTICPAQAREMAGRVMSVDEVMTAVVKDQLFYDESGGGVTFSGGEPLGQPDFLLALLAACADHELHRCVDTSGFAPWSTLAAVAAQTDLFLYDLKHMDRDVHRRATGVDNACILDNLRRLVHLGAAVIVRLPLIPGLNDDAATVDGIGRFLEALRGVDTLHLLPYHAFQRSKYLKLGRPYPGRAIAPKPGRRLPAVADQLRRYGLTVVTGG